MGWCDGGIVGWLDGRMVGWWDGGMVGCDGMGNCGLKFFGDFLVHNITVRNIIYSFKNVL